MEVKAVIANNKKEMPRHAQPTNDQKAKAHIIADEKGLTRGQYRRIAAQVTGVTSMLHMTETQGLRFIHVLQRLKK